MNIKNKRKPIIKVSPARTIADEVEHLSVLSWIRCNIIPDKKPFMKCSSADLAAGLEEATGIHVSNEDFKTYMLECGYAPESVREKDWHFRISDKSPALRYCPITKRYIVSKDFSLYGIMADGRLSLSDVGFLTVIMYYYHKGQKFTADDIKDYTYNSADMAAGYLDRLAEYGYIKIAE